MNNWQLSRSFVENIASLKIPCYCTGAVMDTKKEIKFFEVVIKRPQKYNDKEMLARIPKTFKGHIVKIY